jgi:hypothetical protein
MHTDEMNMGRVQVAMWKAIRNWLYDPNVALIDFGWPERKGQLVEDELCIRIHVRQKYSPGPRLEEAIGRGLTRDSIPEEIDGFQTDVPEGRYRLQQGLWWGRRRRRGSVNPRTRRTDPMQGGISISSAHRYTYATLGGLVTDRNSGADMILSNWHVLAGTWGAQPGQRIYQPGMRDGGTRADTIATLSRDVMKSHHLDAAVARLTGSRELINRQFGLWPVQGVGQPRLGMEVTKSGRQTDVTYGRVTNAILGTADLWYSGMYFTIHNVITIEPLTPSGTVSSGGDSGSWWLDRENRTAIGLHFAGYDRPERALAIDMQSVVDALSVDIVTSV